MPATVTQLYAYPETSFFGTVAGARSGDWIVWALNTGRDLWRYHIPSGTGFVTTPWKSGGRSDNAGNEFIGSMGHVALYNTILSGTRILDHYNVGIS